MDGNALVLDGRLKADCHIAEKLHDSVSAWLSQRDWHVSSRQLCNEQIAPCIGCFGCWVKTPGVCVIDDAGREVAEQIVQSDLVVYLTPIQFGGYSHELKKAIDRSIPIISPYFRKVNGEVHHKRRYASYPNVAAFAWSDGSQGNEDRDVFETLVMRNAINMFASRTTVGFVDSDNPSLILEVVARDLEAVIS